MKFDDLNIGDVIGRGEYGAVYSGSWKQWNGEVAIEDLLVRRANEVVGLILQSTCSMRHFVRFASCLS